MRLRLALVVLLPLAALAYACSDDDTSPVAPVPDAGPAPVVAPPDAAVDAGPLSFAIPFEARMNGQAWRCGSSYAPVGMTGATVKPQDGRFFLSDAKLVRKDTGESVPITLAAAPMQANGVALIDFEDATGDCSTGTPETNTTLSGSVPAGSYDGIELTVGIPESMNHVNMDTAPAPLLGSGLQWSWNSGFIFFAVGLVPQGLKGDGGAPESFFSHIGSTMCTGNVVDGGSVTCARSNRMHVKLTGFDPATSKIVLDLEKIFTGSNVMENLGGAPGCMSFPGDPECPAVYERLGLRYDDGTSAGNPSIFSVGAR